MHSKQVQEFISVFQEICEELEDLQYNEIVEIAEATDVSFQDLYLWRAGKVEVPIPRTFFAVAAYMGYL